jgi:drug/metabolite transporter (DMT)-like permease
MAIGFGGILVRWCDVNPVASAFWRRALAAPFLWAWAFAVQKQDNAQGKRTDFTVVLLLAGVFFAGDLGVWHLSLFYTTVANATLLSNLAPLFVTLWAWGIQKERIRLLFLAGMVAALTGAGMLVGPNAALGGDRLLGDGLGFTTAFLYAAYQVTVKMPEAVTVRPASWPGAAP